MALITIEDVSIRFRGPALLDSVSTTIQVGDRIGLLGRNGAGKTTFLKILTGAVEPDHGQIVTREGTRVALLQQDVPSDLAGPTHAIVSSGLADAGLEEWEVERQTETLLSRMNLSADAAVDTMSSGMKRRVLLARALVSQPDLLLLDEPTNHLDIDSIRWLENFLQGWQQAFMFITHDRQFLRQLASRILEIESGRLFDWTCDYDTFLRRKEEQLAALEKQEALFDKKLAEEEAWIRQGIKARRTRNEGRVRRLKELREQRSARASKQGTSNLQIQDSQRSGNLVLKASEVGFSRGDRRIVDGFSTTIMRGDKVGIVGPNGAGKTTLLKLLLGQLEPDTGSVRLGTNLQIAYFDQLRDQLDLSKSAEEEVADGYQTVDIGGGSRHVLGYLQDFLFTPARARTEIKLLSGGERNRVLLAKLFAKPANLIVLDEPTNDLDAETLEMLEARLVDFQGTLLVVSHDREFLNNVVSSTIVFEETDDGPPAINEYVGGYDDWLKIYTARQKAQANASASAAPQAAKATTPAPPKTQPAKPRKLSFKEQKELEQLPEQIEQLEAKIAEAHEQMAQPEFYQKSGDELAAAGASLSELQSQLDTAYARWEELEAV